MPSKSCIGSSAFCSRGTHSYHWGLSGSVTAWRPAAIPRKRWGECQREMAEQPSTGPPGPESGVGITPCHAEERATNFHISAMRLHKLMGTVRAAVLAIPTYPSSSQKTTGIGRFWLLNCWHGIAGYKRRVRRPSRARTVTSGNSQTSRSSPSSPRMSFPESSALALSPSKA
jgi:hypothetical protein